MGNGDQKQVEKESESLATDIISHIKKHPGVHFNDLTRALNIAPGTLQYHLNRMERDKSVIVLRKEYYTRYFPSTMEDPKDQKIMVLLRQKLPRKLLIILLEESNKTGQELIKLLKITKSTLSYYTRRLEKLEILKTEVEGREKRYSINEPERIAKLLNDFKKSFADEMVDRFVEVWVRI